MAYSGYLIKVGGSSGTNLPMKFIKPESYEPTPNQRLETEAKRNTEGKLVRNTVEHTATKIEFETPVLTNAQVSELNALLFNAMSTAADIRERKLDLEYYDNESDSYKVGTFYMPDVKYPINHIDAVRNIIYYDPIKYSFIEY